MGSVLPSRARSYPIPADYSPPGMEWCAIPRELREYRSWVGWKYGKTRTSGKREKVPINPRTGGRASVDKATTWGAYEEAVAAVERFRLEGVGFVFSENDPYSGIDQDDCNDPGTGEVHPYAQQIVDRLGGYAEISPSGTGVKSIVKARKPGGRCKAVGPWGGEIEMYDSRRFFALTGRVYNPVEVIPDAQRAVEALYRRIWPEGKAAAQEAVSGPHGGFSGEDKELLEKARNAQNGWKFRALYDHGGLSLYGGNHSGADQALCEMLAFWTGRDHERIERLFRGSALYREKWEREDYRKLSIDKACTRCTVTYTGKMPAADAGAQERLAQALEDVRRDPWDYRGGATDRKVYRALVVTGGGEGRAYRNGVIVDPTTAEIGLEASVSDKHTQRRSLDRLQERGKLEILDRGGRGKKAKYLLTPSAKPHHKDPTPPCELYGVGLPTHKMRGVYNPPRKAFDKNGRPTPAYVGPPEKRLQPRCGHVLDIVHDLGGVVDFGDIADRMGATTPKERYDLKRRYVTPLVDRGLLIHEHGLYALPGNAADRFADYLENSGCDYAERQQIKAIEEAQERWEEYRQGEKSFPQEYREWLEAIRRAGPPEPVEVEVPVEEEHDHGLGCDCIDCSIPAPRYAVPYGMRAA